MSGPADAPLIEVENLGVRLNTSRGPAQAIREVSFSLRRGETLGLVGESGCGKSVTALALMGLLPDGACGVDFNAILQKQNDQYGRIIGAAHLKQ